MTGELEIITGLVGLLRVFGPGCGHGDKYRWCCTVRRIDAESCELMGVMTAPTREEARALVAELRAAGFRRIVETRIVNGVTRTVTHEIG